ncbi:muramoyltetrapeptide carboxypeptidase [Melghirimyces profundicolus]|uniref:Muramoyltetrapeptide carboxypeptidase n=1 Tax=Melghirimyces profundicolus TaxID=1242148 RepID=A0A2T6BQU5_9BACL|nr:LD-carboxypeptidase [Melghirimyces profundicolus]PTX58473.1 muramoyltetrapeptide carboxypeptidase [Melghirimyces profundicolus]
MAIKPPMLRPGDTIGIVTPGSPEEADVINDRIDTLRGMGFNVVLGQYVYAENGFLAGTDQQRAFDLMSMFENEQVNMIMPTRGGVGVAGILPYLDYNLIRRNPKIVTGYSDITVLLNVLYQLSNLVTFHGLMLVNFHQEEPAYNFEQYFEAVTQVNPFRRIENPPDKPQISRVPGNVTGPVVGGNLTPFVGTLGTPFDIDTRGKILLLEEVNEPMTRVYRYLNHLKLAGKFDDCIGIILGECTDCIPSFGVTYEDLINDFLVPLGKPLMTNVATAHGEYKTTIPIGVNVNLNTFENTLTVVEPAVSPYISKRSFFL